MIAIENNSWGAAPVFECDFCDQRIRTAGEGIYLFCGSTAIKKEVAYIVHKGKCDRGLKATLGYDLHCSGELAVLPVYLLRNLDLTWAEAKELSRDVSGIDLLKGTVNGYVYVLKYERFHKIGSTANLKDRIRTISASMPERPTLVHVIECEDHRKVERRLHENLARYRCNGEWFELPEFVVNDLKEIEYA